MNLGDANDIAVIKMHINAPFFNKSIYYLLDTLIDVIGVMMGLVGVKGKIFAVGFKMKVAKSC